MRLTLQYWRNDRLGDGHLGYVHLVYAIGHTVAFQSRKFVRVEPWRGLFGRYEIVEVR